MNRRTYPHGLHGHARNLHAYSVLYQLLFQIASQPHKPPITLFIILLNLTIHAIPRLEPLSPPHLRPYLTTLRHLTTPNAACLHPSTLQFGAYQRLLTAPIVHLSDAHVIYNVASFYHKARLLEPYLGPTQFLLIIVYLALTSSLIYISIASFITPSPACVAGFSAVIFGLKPVLNAIPGLSSRASTIMGVQIPGASTPWVELVLASLVMPNVSFVGHLSGILAGFALVKAVSTFTGLVHLYRSIYNRIRPHAWGRGRYAR